MIVLVTCKNEEDPIEMKAPECLHHKSMGFFFRRSRAANSALHYPIRLNFELSQNFIVVLITCKISDDPIKNEGASVFTTLYINF